MNKRLLSMLFVSLLFLSACGETEEPDTSETAQAEEETTQEVDEKYINYSILFFIPLIF